VGEELNCVNGTWSGSPKPTYAYQWVRDAGVEETVIASASANTYKLTNEDRGHSISCEVTATNSAGSSSVLSKNNVRVAGAGPQVQVPPKVLGVAPVAPGETLTCEPGTWSGAPPPTFKYQWLSGPAIIPGATGSTYGVQTSDQLSVLSCKVIASNSAGREEAQSSNGIKVRGSAPENTAPPTLVGSPVPVVSSTLTCMTGTWKGLPAPELSIRWVRDRQTPGEEALGSSAAYTITEADRGHSLSCEVTATNVEGPPVIVASESLVVPAGAGGTAPSKTEAPMAYGERTLGAAVYCAPGAWSGTPTPVITIQWLRDGLPISLATKSTYAIVAADLAHALSCRVTATNSEGVLSATSNALEIPGVKPQASEAPQVSGLGAVGQQLTCLRGTWSAAPAPTFSYQWFRSGAAIRFATQSAYTITNEDRGRSISCVVTASNSQGETEAVSANSIEVPGNEPRDLTLPKVSGTPAAESTLTCAPGAWSGEPTPTFAYQWLLNGVEIPSATSNKYTVARSDRGLSLSCRVTGSNVAGSRSATSEPFHIPGIKPELTEAPQISGTPGVGQQLKCMRGSWNGQPPPNFSYQWLRDGAPIASATGASYTVELTDQGHELSCVVTATNSEGKGEARSKAVTIAPVGPEARPELTFGPPAPPPPTSAQILAALRKQLARAQHRARLSSLRKKGYYAFTVSVPAAGTLELVWYLAPANGQHSSNARSVTVAAATTSFSRAATKTISLRLTSQGRRLLEHSNGLQLTLRGVFAQPHARPLTWLKTVGLPY
jgi:hypothetical protein